MKIKNWIIFFVISCLITVLSYQIQNISTNQSFDVKDIQKQLFERKQKALIQFDEIQNTLKTNGLQQLFSNKTLQNKLKCEHLIVLVYENDSLQYWSDNKVVTDNVFNKSQFADNKIINLNNAWFWLVERKIENRNFVALILLKNEYSYKNKFLQNTFYLDGKFDENTVLSNIPNNSTSKILDENNQFLFSLSNQNSKVENCVFTEILFLVFFIFSILSLAILLYLFVLKWNKNIAILTFLFFLFFVRIALQYFKIPTEIYSLNIFEPIHYASSNYFPSLGDLLLTSIFVLVFVLVYNFHFKNKKLPVFGVITNNLIATFLISISAIFAFLIHTKINNLVFNSNINLEAYKVLSINYLSFISYFIIVVLLVAFCIFVYQNLRILLNIITFKNLSILIFFTTIILYLISFFAKISIDFAFIIFWFISVFSIIIYESNKFKFSLLTVVYAILILTAYTVFVITNASQEREKNVRKVLAVNLANERDAVAEILVSDLEIGLKSDTSIQRLITSKSVNEVYKKINRYYFHGFWSKYDFQITICTKSDSLIIENSGEQFLCSDFFNKNVDEMGTQIPNTDFFYLDNQNGRISYLGIIEYKLPAENQKITLYLELDSKLISQELGYPELLLDDKVKPQQYLNEYSYAKYKNGKLLTKQGEFSYGLNVSFLGNIFDEFTFIDKDNFEHLIYKMSNDNIIVISVLKSNLFDIIVSFSYVFGLFMSLWFLYFVSNSIYERKQIEMNLRLKIQLSFILILLLTLVIIGGGTIFYNIRQHENKQIENISEKMQSISIEIQRKLGDEAEITGDLGEYTDYLLVRFSNIFYSDINFYDVEGNLFASSRSEIFKKGLVGKKMNPEAYSQLILSQKAEYFHSENIGELNYLSAYKPFYNNQEKLLGYINLPYFAKQNVLKKEISTLIAAIVNIYVFLILIAIFVAILISNSITKPLRMLMTKFREMEIGKNNEPINYSSNDEIGSLVKEYNRMLNELTINIEKLATSERESAWREMAKQIAHEIKNPLTPMKLSVQHLQMTWKNNDADFENRLNNFSKTLIEQINSLSTIATEFSNFAKMPQIKKEKIDLIPLINSCVDLFKNTENVHFSIENSQNTNIQIIGDNEQILRVFNNILKNAIQAIPENRIGEIKIKLDTNYELKTVLISISDNGSGINEETKSKLFTPNFTTKTSGMGLGLAIVKEIVEMLNGKIWFETEIGKGTVFYIEFPLF